MKAYLLINPEHPGVYYSLFYFLAFVVGFALLMLEGRKRKFAMIPWMMVIATAFLFFMTGCRFIAFSKNEWTYVLRFQSIPYSTGLSVLGGILLSIPGILLAKKCLRFQHDMVDAFAYVLPVGLMIQRFGCWIAGCCYGTPTALPWAIQYDSGSHAFMQHINEGLLLPNSHVALPVHPVQIYEALSCFFLIVFLFTIRKKLKAPGNFFMTSVAIYGIIRFLLEFVRASGGHAVGGGHALGLNFVQWALLLIVPATIHFIAHRENTNRSQQTSPVIYREPLRPALYFLLVGTMFLFISRWLSALEIVSFNIVLLPLLATLTVDLFTWVTVPRYRLASLFLPLVALLLMNQTLPEYSKKDSTRLSYNTISLGWISGSSATSSYYSTGGCNSPGSSYSSNYNNSYSAQALGIARTIQQEPNKIMSFGMDGFVGTHHEVSQLTISGTQGPPTTQNINQQFSYYGVRPYLQFDRRRYGVGVGLNFGQLHNISYPSGGSSTLLESSVEKYNVFPSLNFRFGDLRRFFFEYKLANRFPTNFPALNSQLAWGIGFGNKFPGNIRLGTASHVGFFIAPCFPIGDHIIAEAYFGWGKGFNPDYANISQYGGAPVNNSVQSVSLHYKFARKEHPVGPHN